MYMGVSKMNFVFSTWQFLVTLTILKFYEFAGAVRQGPLLDDMTLIIVSVVSILVLFLIIVILITKLRSNNNPG